MPGPDYAGIVTFYEDFPYAWWNDFQGLEDLGTARSPHARDVEHLPEYADVGDQLERKIAASDV